MADQRRGARQVSFCATFCLLSIFLTVLLDFTFARVSMKIILDIAKIKFFALHSMDESKIITSMIKKILNHKTG